MEGPHHPPARVLRNEMEALQFIDTGTDGRVTDASRAHPTLDLREAQGAFVHSGRFPHDRLDFMKRPKAWVRSAHGTRRPDCRRRHDCQMPNMSPDILVASAGEADTALRRRSYRVPVAVNMSLFRNRRSVHTGKIPFAVTARPL